MNIVDLHADVWAQLLARRAQLPHALLIAGQRGLGKFELARRFADFLLCEKPQAAQACGVCAACGWLEQGNHPDFRLLQPQALAEESGEGVDTGNKKKPSQQITIDQVRALDDFLHVGTHRHGARVILINPAEAMNRATANSLLKALEEPIINTLFLLVSSEADRLLPTIRSRCQLLAVPQPTHELAAAWLAQAGISAAAHWLALAGGAPLLAVELAGDDEHAALAVLIAEMSRGGQLDPLVAAAAVDRVVKADKRPAPLKRTIEWSQKWLLDLALASQGLPSRYFLDHEQVLRGLAQATTTPNLLAFGRKTLQYKSQSEQPLNSRLFLEEFFMAYAALFRAS